MTQRSFLTIGQLAEQLQEPVWRVRRAADSVAPNLPRAGLYRLVPAELIESIDKRLRADSASREAAR